MVSAISTEIASSDFLNSVKEKNTMYKGLEVRGTGVLDQSTKSLNN